MTTDIASLGIEIRSDGVLVASKRLQEMERQSKKTETATERLVKRMERLEQTAGRLGRQLTMGITTPLLGIAAASVKMATTFESELTKMNTLVGVSTSEINQFRQSILQLAPAVGRGPEELARAMFAITSAGARGTQAMETLEAAAKASAIGLGDTRDIALTAVSAVTAYGEANLSASEAVEILVGTVEQGNLEASQLAGVLGRVLSIAAETGVSFRDAGAFVAAFTRQGVDAAQAVTGLRGVLTTLIREPTAQAQEAFDKMGLSVEGFKQSVREEGFISAFQSLVNLAEESGVSLGQVIPEVEALSGALAVFASEGASAAQIAEDVGAAVGTLEERLAAAMESDPALAFAQLRAELSAMLIEIGTNILPAVIDLTVKIRELLDEFNQLSDETKTAAGSAALFAGALGPMLVGLSGTLWGLRQIHPLLPAIVGKAGLGGLALAAGVFIGHRLDQHMRDVADGTKGMADETRRAASEWTEYTKQVNEAQRAHIQLNLDRLEAEMNQWARALRVNAGEATQAQIDYITELQEEYQEWAVRLEQNRRLNDNLIESTNNLSGVIGGYIRAMMDAGSTATKATQTTQGWLDALTALRTEAAGPSAVAANDFAMSVRDVIEAVGKGEMTINDAREAIKLYREEMERTNFDEMAKANDTAYESLKDMMDELEGWDNEELKAVADELERIANLEFNMENLAASFHPVAQELLYLKDVISEIDVAMNEGVINPAQAGWMKVGSTANFAFNAMKSGMDSASKAYKRIEQVQQLANIALGIGAIMQQGMGDPYTAFARMAAMAAMVASFGVSVRGGGGSGGGLTAADRQSSQGSGSVLGDASAQSETIVNALEMQTDALEKLIGINSSMRTAIQDLADSIGRSALFLARNFDPMRDTPTGVSRLIDRTVPGKRELDDLGLDLMGGLIMDMIEETLVSGFVQRKHRIDTGLAAEGVGEQFSAILAEMVDTVTEAALMLGVPLDDIEARIATFRIESQKISLMDLSATEQQEQLNAVFGRIFDDLALAVVPFAAEFQQVGEGLGETLIRMVTSIQVTEEAVLRLGLSIGELDPETMARVSVGLIEAAGGLEQFIDQMESFIDKFAPEAHKFEIAQNDITRAFEAMGLALPETREGFWELIQTIDATTEAGQQQIATILGLTESADAYYKFLEDAEKDRIRQAKEAADAAADAALAARQMAQELRESMAGIDREILRFGNASMAAYLDLRDAQVEQIITLRDLGASEEQLARARRLHHLELQRFTNDLKVSILTLADELFGTEDAIESVSTGIARATTNIRDSFIRALEGIDAWLDRSLLANFSPLTPTERLGEAQAQFDAAMATAASDPAVLASLPGLADALLGEGASFFGTSTAQFRELFDQVRAAMERAADFDPPEAMDGPPTFRQVERVKTETSAFRKALDELNKASALSELGTKLGALAGITEGLPSDIARDLGFSEGQMRTVLEGLGVDVGSATGSELEDQFNEVIGGITGESGTNALLGTMNRLIGLLDDYFRNEFSDKLAEVINDHYIEPPPDQEPVLEKYATGGWVPRTEPALVHSGEYVVPRKGTLIHSDPSQTAILERIDTRLRNLERINSGGFSGIQDEERRTRQAMTQRRETARA